MAARLIHKVLKHDGQKARFDRSRIKKGIKKAILAVEKYPKHSPDKEAELFTMEVVAEIKKQYPPEKETLLHVEQIQDIILNVLHKDMSREFKSYSSMPEALWMTYMLYREGHNLVRNGLLPEQCFRKRTVPVEMLAESRLWAENHNCRTIEQLKEWYDNGRLRHLIMAAENRLEDQLLELAIALENRINEKGLKAVLITGPTCSGKTTTTKKAAKLLSDLKPEAKFKPLELDNYFKGLDANERIAYNVDGREVIDTNYELPESYDIQLINEHLSDLLAGKTVMVPTYDFASGKRMEPTIPFRMEPGEILLIDCMHALSPQLTEAIPAANKFKLYIEALSVLEDENGRPVRWTDLRLMRRMVRDVWSRGYSMQFSLWHWHLVRKGERFLLPYIYTADMMVDGGLPYEIPMLKSKLESELKEMMPMFERNPDLFDGRERGRRILALLSQLDAAREDQTALVPDDSVLREFIGPG